MPQPEISGTQEEQLKAALWYSVGKIVDDCAVDFNLNAEPRFIGSLSELVWAQINNTAVELEAFANHAGRSTINASDAVLLGRGNDGLKEALQDSAVKAKSQNAARR